jgi:Bacterial Ig domain
MKPSKELREPLRIRPSHASALLLLLAICPPASALCNGDPGAVDDVVVYTGGAALVVDVLANDSEPDGEALTVGNLSTTCTGTVSQDLGLVTLAVTSFSGACTIGYRITDERGSFDTATVSVLDGTEIFSDGFETGDTSQWTG